MPKACSVCTVCLHSSSAQTQLVLIWAHSEFSIFAGFTLHSWTSTSDSYALNPGQLIIQHSAILAQHPGCYCESLSVMSLSLSTVNECEHFHCYNHLHYKVTSMSMAHHAECGHFHCCKVLSMLQTYKYEHGASMLHLQFKLLTCMPDVLDPDICTGSEEQPLDWDE